MGKVSSLLKEKIPTISIKKTEKNGNIESQTKIIYSPEYDEKIYNYNTFCVFKSIDEIFYLVHIKKETHIVFYNLFDERNVIEIFTGDYNIIEIKYLFDENNKRDLLFSFSEYFTLKLWNVNNCECLLNIKNIFKDILYECNHLGILKLNDKSYSIIVSNKYEDLKIYDLNGNKLNDNYRNNLNIENENSKKLFFIDTYYDKISGQSYIFFINDDFKSKLFSVVYQKNILYQTYGFLNYRNRQILINDDNEKIIKILFLMNPDSIGIFNFHSGELLYKINFKITPFPNNVFNDQYHYDSIYSLNCWNSDYIVISYGKVVESDVHYGQYGSRDPYDKKFHSIEVVNLKERKIMQVLKLTTIDKSIFTKKIFHPKYGDCLLTQDNSGEIKIIQIKLV